MATQIKEAVAWMEDIGAISEDDSADFDVENDRHVGAAIAFVNANYEGGWAQFLRDTESLTSPH